MDCMTAVLIHILLSFLQWMTRWILAKAHANERTFKVMLGFRPLNYLCQLYLASIYVLFCSCLLRQALHIGHAIVMQHWLSNGQAYACIHMGLKHFCKHMHGGLLTCYVIVHVIHTSFKSWDMCGIHTNYKAAITYFLQQAWVKCDIQEICSKL